MSTKHLIRMAGRIQRHLSRPTVASMEWGRAVNEVISRLGSIQRHWNLSQEASRRGWLSAAASKDLQIVSEAARLQAAVEHLRTQLPTVRLQSAPPSLGTIIAELQQLGDEFDDVEIDLKQNLIGVTTEPIVLEGTHLGPFTINLHVSRLADRLDSACFNCVALEPNPAASNDSTVHPHVQDGHLCAGDASVPISAALKDGRIADAFILVRSVLQNYNPDSPYIALEHWSGRRCEECDYITDSDSLCFCDGCEKDVCEDCYSSCDLCDQGCCRSCLETDSVSGNRCCAACRRTCRECSRTVDRDSFDEESELCPACLANQKPNPEQENQHESPTINAPITGAASITGAEPTPSPEKVPAAA
jgi:hypothetical protein